MVRIMARISAREACEAKLREVLQALIAPSRGESGCVSYELFENEDRPLEFVTVEQWADQAAADAHLATPHVAAAMARAGDFLAQAPLIHRFRQVG
ncbi:MAG: antibiotic biosynthesis monooxygenase [Propionivibrio sp.]|uniref:putative quinol monooxygenase n=1 Tax=Propionivibrio sp. TaxID=2212460 RepID=UPI001A6184D7|nr:putative quinol monooxygenase [Propionivibrio sp.]MBL8416490.1 antibiotic biosynthesis monooxygenase [Propionivibrio sp.]